jgi:hypothetical protein
MLLGSVALHKTVVFDNVADRGWPFDMTKEECGTLFFSSLVGCWRKMAQQRKLSQRRKVILSLGMTKGL